MQYIVIIGAFQALISLWFLRAREKKAISNSLFIILLSAIAVHLIIKFVIFKFIPDESIKQQMNTFISACYGPLVYLYTLTKSTKDFNIAAKWYIFIPFFVLMIGYFTISGVFIIIDRVDQKLLDTYNNISMIVLFAINLYYPLKSIFIANKTRNRTLSNSDYSIIIRISGCLLLMDCIVIISKVLLHILPQDTQIINDIVRSAAYILLLIICLLILRKNLVQESASHTSTNTFESLLLPANNQTETVTENKTIDYESRFRELWEKLDNLVVKQQLFRNYDLTLDLLSAQTSINKYQISEMLNGYKHKSFYSYINEYRIEYFKHIVNKAIEKDEDINFLSLAYEAGFKSKSSFNRYFKEINGETPSEYYKNIVQQKAEDPAVF
ncbi:helix-turn-helix domain-containing protein [Elizabethkingia sp. HX XZB]|uniref:helix-turn-helix domain-containing protein n=1 Tax=Elizabethkingia sp. HX XZB TaxID=3003193 RepID=UPI002A247CF5|nr:helix-turn-helix domain-containing protein [Elizabethkingia sp. HX XZB]MDX8568057.1 helix-turn-helix domain-containing protein [Elizabethkingia sp. HX XZB]